MSDVLQRLGDAIKMLNERDATIATLTAELAEAREQRDSLRDECERLREALREIAEWTDRYTAPGHPISTAARRALSASGREVENDGR